MSERDLFQAWLARPVDTPEQAWDIVYSYAHRWKMEEQFRFQKTELQIESLRLQHWEPRRKLLFLLTLVYGFLLWVLGPSLFLARARLLVHWGQRADWRQWQAKLPVYRLRWAFSRLWMAHPPSFLRFLPYHPPTHITWPPCSLRWWVTLWHQAGYLFYIFALGHGTVKAGLTLEWSQGAAEGHVHRLKLLKRQAYGRASFQTLRKRVLRCG